MDCFAIGSNGIAVERQRLPQRRVLWTIGTNSMMTVVAVAVVHTMDFGVLSLRLNSVHRLHLFA